MTPPITRRQAKTIAAVALAVSALASIGFAAATVSGNSVELEGLTLALALGGLAIAFALWGKRFVAQPEITEEREPLESTPEERLRATSAFIHGSAEISRPGFLGRFLVAALSLFGIAALFPLRGLGPNPHPNLFKTKWTPGARLVRSDGSAVRHGDLEVGAVTTVFPDGFVGSEDSQTLLLRLPPATLPTTGDRPDWSPGG